MRAHHRVSIGRLVTERHCCALARGESMEKAYWLGRKRASLKQAKLAACSISRLVHYELAGRYSLKAASTETRVLALADALPPSISRRRKPNAGASNV